MTLYYAEISDLISEAKTGLTKTFSFANGVSGIDLSKVESDDFSFSFEQIVIDDSYYGSDTFFLLFTSSTEYKVYHTRAEIFDQLYRGVGTISTDFELEGYMEIPENTFSGEIFEGDKISFTITRNFSMNDALSYLETAQENVDEYVKSLRVLKLASVTEPVFGTDYALVPRVVRQSVAKFALAEMIEKRLFPVSLDSLGEGYTSALRNSARKLLSAYVEKYRDARVFGAKLSTKVLSDGDITATQIARTYPELRAEDFAASFAKQDE